MKKSRKANTMARLAEVLQVAVNSGHVTVPEIVERSGVERSLVYKYLKGTQPGITLDTLERLMEAVGVNPAELFPGGPRLPGWFLSALERMLEWGRGK